MNKNMIKLDNRLQAIYDMIRQDSKIVDVGTDHGYLITKLILDQKSRAGKCIDINSMCLKKARDLATKYNLNQQINFSISDGLEDVLETEADDIVIAGMGSELIINILEKCNWVKKVNNKHLILQPMKNPWILREYLFKNKFKIIDEKVVVAKKIFYVIIKAIYTDQIYNYLPTDIFIGTLLNNKNQITKDYLLFLYNKFNNIANNISSSNLDVQKYKYYKNISKKLKTLIN